MVVPSSEAQRYKRLCARMLRGRQPVTDLVSLTLDLYPRAPKRRVGDWERRVRCIDLDNAAKIVIDALEGLVFVNDKQIYRYHSERHTPCSDPRIEISVDYYR